MLVPREFLLVKAVVVVTSQSPESHPDAEEKWQLVEASPMNRREQAGSVVTGFLARVRTEGSERQAAML